MCLSPTIQLSYTIIQLNDCITDGDAKVQRQLFNYTTIQLNSGIAKTQKQKQRAVRTKRKQK